MARRTFGFLSTAMDLFRGVSRNPFYNKNDRAPRGVECSIPIYRKLGTPVVAAAGALISAATSTELPNNTTITYTFATQGGSSPLDGANSTGVLDVARNVTAAATHGSSVVAMTLLIKGLDINGAEVWEQLSIAATGTSQSAAGKKAFKSITSIAITSAGNATTNTLNMGFGDVIGLPFKISDKNEVKVTFDGAEDAATIVIGDTTTPSATTGDVRGTIDPSGTLNGTKSLSVLMWNVDATDPTGVSAHGLAQYKG